jgi:hypothetical protein
MAHVSRSNPFRSGDCILYRQCDDRQIIDVKPVTVVEDSEERIALWLPLGTPTKQPMLLDHEPGTPRRWRDGEWQLVDSTWRVGESLILVQPNEHWAIWLSWTPEWTFAGWYVNLQSELRRTQLGFDFTDYQFDIVVRPDRTWQLKDEEEFAIAVESGTISEVLAARIRQESHRAMKAIKSNAPPYCDGWENWRPEGNMPRPELRPGWDALFR